MRLYNSGGLFLFFFMDFVLNGINVLLSSATGADPDFFPEEGRGSELLILKFNKKKEWEGGSHGTTSSVLFLRLFC